MSHTRFDLKSFDDLKKLPDANVVKFEDGPMQGITAGIKTKNFEANCWYGEPKTMWDKKDFCEKIVIRARDEDFSLASIRPFIGNEVREDEYTTLLYVLVDGAYRWEPNFLKG